MDISYLKRAPIEKETFSDEAFHLIREVIYKKCGIYFGDNKKYFLKNRISKRMREENIKNFEEYYRALKDGGSVAQKRELSILLNSITVNETSFFRNEPQLNAFIDQIVPEVIRENKEMNKRRLKIWSAGCSTGEEPYTIAIMLLEKGISHHSPNIMATDINDNALEYARRGKYTDNTLRRVPVPYLEKHFTYDGTTGFIVRDNIKRMIEFKNVNLLDERELRLFREFDIVFCRNVIIYFDDIVKKRVIKNIRTSLRNGGYLFIGHSESLHNISNGFQVLNFEKAQVYKKRG